MTKNTLGHCEAMRWKEQALTDALAWHTATGSLTASNETAYRAGYEQGYREALSALQRHGHITIDTNR